MASPAYTDEVLPESPRSPQSPDTLTSVTAMARFEFEPARGNDGTKVMMVEWEDEDKSRTTAPGTWSLVWPGRKTSVPADERTNDRTRRMYFLIPPKTPVPPQVSLRYQPRSGSKVTEPLRLTIYPLPAIFTPELGASAKASGMKGVLHTIWAKKRLQVLEKEIRHEQEFNLEGIALEMAQAERAWIENNFGVLARPSLDLSGVPRSPVGPSSPTLQSPRSPSGRRLSDKLKGLSIATDDKSLRARGVNTPIKEEHPLSPEDTDMAYSSFKSFRNGPVSPTAARSRKVVGQAPPKSIRDMQSRNAGGMTRKRSEEDTSDDLFAKALSPRSADDPKSPFSLTSEEVSPYARLKGSR